MAESTPAQIPGAEPQPPPRHSPDLTGLRSAFGKLVAWGNTPKRRGFLLGVFIGLSAFGFLLPWAPEIGDNWIGWLVVTLFQVALVAIGIFGTIAVVYRSFLGVPLLVSSDEMTAGARETYRERTEWTTSLDSEDAVAAIAAALKDPPSDISDATLRRETYDAGIWVRASETFQPETYPATAPTPKPVKVQAPVTFVVTGHTGDRRTITAYWDSVFWGGHRDVIREGQRMSRVLIKTAREATEAAERVGYGSWS